MQGTLALFLPPSSGGLHYLASVPKRETRGTAQKVHSPSAWCHHSCEQDSECGTPHPCTIQGCRRASNPPCPHFTTCHPPATLSRPRASCGHKGVTTAPLHPQWWCGKAHAVRNRWIGVGSFADLPSLLDVYLTITSTQSDDGLKSIHNPCSPRLQFTLDFTNKHCTNSSNHSGPPVPSAYYRKGKRRQDTDSTTGP